MVQYVKTYQKCFQCNGTGQQTTGAGATGSGPFTCVWPGCVNGYVEIGNTELDPGLDEILSKVNDAIDKIDDIKDIVDEL